MKRTFLLPACTLAAALAFLTSGLAAQGTDSSRTGYGSTSTTRTTTTTTTTSTARPSNAISDSAIIAMLELGDQQEIAAAELASTHAKSDRVKQFAERLRTDHTKSLQALQQYAEHLRGAGGMPSGMSRDTSKRITGTVQADTTRVNVSKNPDSTRVATPGNIATHQDTMTARPIVGQDTTSTRRDSAMSGRDMSAMTGRRDSAGVGTTTGQLSPALQNLQTLSGHEFDHGFVELEVQDHQEAIHRLRTDIIPMIKDPGLKSLVQGMLPTLGTHLREAQELQQYLKTVN